ncbi:MAG: hypothetical protein NZ602_01455 [Thermoguttaceae bacterium]|nr:hypothetical protein [Thermoguttaceae bacterium]MDW8039066.1 hypothetical protein [Thermoguttaceae bacterium]
MGTLLLAVGSFVGCSRAYHRTAADTEVSQVVQTAAQQISADLSDYTIQPNPRSRLFDPCDPDFPPMPPDDMAAHRLMECVDGKRGSSAWGKYGRVGVVDFGHWRQYLPVDDQGQAILNRDTAIQLALLHSREYQRELEDLYLSALDVIAERFRFDVQFFARTSTRFTSQGRLRAGGQSSSLLEQPTSGEAKWLLATGGQWIVSLANSFIWQFSGPDTNAAWTILDFSFIQPLLRAGGRAVALENLTLAERSLLANIRQMEQFRRGFYIYIIAGRGPGPGPSAGRFSLGSPATSGSGTGGLFRLLEDQVRLRNQRANVAALRESMNRLQAFFEAGLLDTSYQVDLARQRLLAAQSALLADTAAYQSRLDAYKMTLGLPPDLKMVTQDPLLERFDLIGPATTQLQEQVTSLLEVLRDPMREVPADLAEQLERIGHQCKELLNTIRQDQLRLRNALPDRRKNLRRLVRSRILAGERIEGIGTVEELEQRVQLLHHDAAHLAEQTAASLVDLDVLQQRAKEEAQPLAQFRLELAELLTQLSSQLLRLSLVQARARLDTATLVPVDLDPDRALEIARQHRLDWMNARMALVDQWRQIELAANRLRSDLDLFFSGDLGTVGDNPVKFRGPNGQLRVGLAWDTPLTRLLERNEYRAALIAYQRARRDYMAFEDRICQNLRDLLRSLELGQWNFEVRRASVLVAITRVDVAQLNLERPPKAGTLQLGANAARDLVEALSDLLTQQNAFLSIWTGYEADRMSLDFELGTMQLDPRGVWRDPGEIGPEGPPAAAPPPPWAQLPQPSIVPTP